MNIFWFRIACFSLYGPLCTGGLSLNFVGSCDFQMCSGMMPSGGPAIAEMKL